MKLTLLGGKNEIGGNKILVEHKSTKILLDFGISMSQASKFFAEFLQPRRCSSISDLIELNLLPDLKGLYRNDYLIHMGRKAEERQFDALLISHAHADHAQYLHFLRNDIPIYSTKPTKIILQALEEIGSNTFSDLITTVETFQFRQNKKGGMSRVDRRDIDYVKERPFNIMEPYQRYKIKDLEVEMLPVDHSLPGACAFIIYSDEGNLVYTGDLRFHGNNKHLTEEFVKRAKASKPKWLLSEGTNIDDDKMVTEKNVQEQITRFIKDAKGLAFVEHPIRDLDRVISVFNSAKANKREFVVTLKLAYFIEALQEYCPFKLDAVKILIPPKSWGLICKKVDCKLIEEDYKEWERTYINRKNAITYQELQKNPIKYVVSMNFFEINNLLDIKPKDAIWIKSSCEPFCDEMEIDEKRKRNWLNHFNIKEYFAHASGHASGKEIKAMIKDINAKQLIPIHTQHPEMF